MRNRFEVQLEFGATPIEKVEIPTKSRDELPPVLRALQYIYSDSSLNDKVFSLLELQVQTNQRMGRPGMSLWEILVFACVRLTLDADYDRLEHIANYDILIRALLGIPIFGDNSKRYARQTLVDNVGLVDEETIIRIYQLVADTGHQLLKKNENLNVKVDTYVLETNVHFPTDLNLLWDAGRKCIEIAGDLYRALPGSGWRKSQYLKKQLKASFRKAAKLSVGAGRLKPKGKNAVLDYLSRAENLSKKLDKSQKLFQLRNTNDFSKLAQSIELQYFTDYLCKHIHLVRRRVISGQKIPHQEKVFSLFEPYTRWIKKGKAGNKVELGLPLAVSTSQYGFILNHKIMEKEQDIDVAVTIAKDLLSTWSNIHSLSFDKGFWSPLNFKELQDSVENLVIPKKGRLNKTEYQREHGSNFKVLRRQHAMIESDINCLEHHGLNQCPDKGLPNFRRYTSIGILAYNLHKLGNILIARDRLEIEMSKSCRKAA